MISPPVALFSFNRPNCTRRALEAIRHVAPSQLFVFCDGPRQGNDQDQQLCQAVRAILDDVDWDCDVERRYHADNRGFSAVIDTGLDWVFSRVGEVIILEDDCVAHPTFFRYSSELLEKYRDDSSVEYIAGFALDTPRELFNGASYAFATLGACWGWATWRDRWIAHRQRFPRSWVHGARGATQLYGRSDTGPRPYDIRAESSGLRWYLAALARDAGKSRIGWDALWGVSVSISGGHAITPSVNMIENIGFGPDATNNTSPRNLPRSSAMKYPLTHPPVRSINVRIARELEFDALWFPVGRFIRLVRRQIPVGFVRTGILRTLNSYPVIRARSEFWRARARLVPAYALTPPGWRRGSPDQ